MSTEKYIECLLQTMCQKIKRGLNVQDCIDRCKMEMLAVWDRDMNFINK